MVDFDCAHNGFSSVRCYSTCNPWIDFVVLIPEVYENIVSDLVLKSLEEYWSSDDLCYGDLVEENIINSGIPYMIFYHPDEELDYMREEEWEQMIQKLPDGFVIPV